MYRGSPFCVDQVRGLTCPIWGNVLTCLQGISTLSTYQHYCHGCSNSDNTSMSVYVILIFFHLFWHIWHSWFIFSPWFIKATLFRHNIRGHYIYTISYRSPAVITCSTQRVHHGATLFSYVIHSSCIIYCRLLILKCNQI